MICEFISGDDTPLTIPSLPLSLTEGTLKRAYGLWQSRQLKDDVHNKRAQYLVPVLDMIDG